MSKSIAEHLSAGASIFAELPLNHNRLSLDIWNLPEDQKRVILDWLCNGGEWTTSDVSEHCRHYLLTKGCYELNVAAIHLPRKAEGAFESLGAEIGHDIVTASWHAKTESLERRTLSALKYALARLSYDGDSFIEYAGCGR